ncbi:MAG: radical SAM protein [Candidatus Helarchaeota archaeon]|nr:radical SAM protein [Candidatus Helarchaeota archaeon]
MEQKNRVLFINPILIRPVVGPIALDYLGYALRKAGYMIDLIDHSFSNLKDALKEYFRKTTPVAIGVTVRNTDDCYFQSGHSFLDEIKDLVGYLKSIQSAPIVLGGVGFSIAPEAILRFCGADFGVQGEGEVALPALLKELQTDKIYSRVPNLIYSHNGGYIHTTLDFVNLHEMTPARDIIDNSRYFQEGGQGNIETKRGCDQKCIYCADPICKGSKIRLRDPAAVCAELKALIAKGVTCFHLCDSEFNNSLSHAKAVCRAIIGEGLSAQMTFYTYCMPRPFDSNLAQLMKEAGCAGINFGVDSGDDSILKTLRRTHRRRDIVQTVELCKQNQIAVMLDLLIGGPGETRASVENTIILMKEIRPDRVGLSIGVRIYPKTGLAKLIQNDGPIVQNPNIRGVIDNNPDFLKPIFYLSSELGGNSVFTFINQLVGKDSMFFFANPEEKNRNYNYNENQILVDAIRRGYRGAYWDILRKLQLNK